MQIRVERRMMVHVPWALLGATFLLAGIGVWNLVSASRPPHTPVWTQQALYVVVGAVALLVVATFDYRFIQRMVIPIYLLNLGMLIALKFIGHKAKGAESWFIIGPFRLQPAEFMKLGVVLVLAKYFHDDTRPNPEGYGLLRLIVPLVLAFVPIGLILVQPDLGTALMMVFTVLTVVLFAKVKRWIWAVMGVGALIGAVIIWNDYVREQHSEPRKTLVRHFLKKHQDARIAGWLDPERDPRGSNYHSIQSKIAVGSGGLTGKGWQKGTQTLLFFLPEQHTDFIFSVWAEEHGFLACTFLLLLYAFILLSALGVAANARERFGAFVAVGVTAMIFWQVFENVGMVTGLLPVTGITLPLMSFGGSSMVSVMMGIGLLVNISMRRHMF